MKPNPLFPAASTLGINTDLYELTMAAAYFAADRAEDEATFELFTRALPPRRSFLIAAGLEQALHYLLSVGFSGETIRYLKTLKIFQHAPPDFFDYLRGFRFQGDVRALPEGTLFFPNEPILQVRAPVIEAQLLETYLINVINFQSMVASKAARLCLSARGGQVVDFGSRRAHSPQAGVMAARACFIGGCQGTSNVLAGYEMGIPVFGTMAHSFVQFFEDESEAFERFHETFKDQSVLLVDTYDTLAGVRRALELGWPIPGVRLDSGNLAELAFKTRALLDEHGRQATQIVASGNLDEEKIHSMTLADVPVDTYGVGTDLVVSGDAPSCDLVYKLVEVIEDGKVSPRIKVSEGKAILPYQKQIFRKRSRGTFAGDLVCREGESVSNPDAQPLLRPFIERGEPACGLPALEEIRNLVQDQLSCLPLPFKLLHTVEEYPVEYSAQLKETQSVLAQQLS